MSAPTGFQDGGVHGSRFVGPVQRIGLTAPHDSDAVSNPYLSRYRGGAMGYPEYRGPLVAPNRSNKRHWPCLGAEGLWSC